MVVFCNFISGKIAIPKERIYQVRQVGCKIEIFYDSGDITWLNETQFCKQISSETVKFDSEELAVENFRSYYNACIKGSGAFYFG